MIFALTLIGSLIAAAPSGSDALTGKMAIYNNWLGARWNCSLGSVQYYAEYSVAPGNVVHGRLYSGDSTEDAYFGYDAKRNLYWTASADSAGDSDTQTSTDGSTFAGTLNSAGTTSQTNNVYTITSANKWTVHAKGSAGGHPYDVTATCVRP